jgi:hypothetical protein
MLKRIAPTEFFNISLRFDGYTALALRFFLTILNLLMKVTTYFFRVLAEKFFKFLKPNPGG